MRFRLSQRRYREKTQQVLEGTTASSGGAGSAFLLAFVLSDRLHVEYRSDHVLLISPSLTPFPRTSSNISTLSGSFAPLATLSFPEVKFPASRTLFPSLAPLLPRRCLSDLRIDPPLRAIPLTIKLARPRGVDDVVSSLNLTAEASNSIFSAASNAADTAVARLWNTTYEVRIVLECR